MFIGSSGRAKQQGKRTRENSNRMIFSNLHGTSNDQSFDIAKVSDLQILRSPENNGSTIHRATLFIYYWLIRLNTGRFLVILNAFFQANHQLHEATSSTCTVTPIDSNVKNEMEGSTLLIDDDVSQWTRVELEDLEPRTTTRSRANSRGKSWGHQQDELHPVQLGESCLPS